MIPLPHIIFHLSVSPSSYCPSPLSLSANRRFHHASLSIARNQILATTTRIGWLPASHRCATTPRRPRNSATNPALHSDQQYDSSPTRSEPTQRRIQPYTLWTLSVVENMKLRSHLTRPSRNTSVCIRFLVKRIAPTAGLTSLLERLPES